MTPTSHRLTKEKFYDPILIHVLRVSGNTSARSGERMSINCVVMETLEHGARPQL